MATNPWEMDWSQASSGPVYGAPDPTMAFRAEDNARDNTRIGIEQERLDITRAADERARTKDAREADEKALKLSRARESSIAKLTDVIGKIDEVSDQAINGWFDTGATGSIVRKYGPAGTDAYDLAANIQKIDATSAFSALQEMRDNSPTGGALGGVSERELDLLRSSVANLDPNQSEYQFLGNLDQARQVYLDTLRRIDPEAAAALERREQNRAEDGGLTGTVTDTSEAAPPAGAAPAPPAGPSGGGGVGEGLLQGVGSIVEGAASIPALVVDPVATTLGRALGYDNYTSDFASQVRNDLGLPRNQSETANNIIRGGVSALGGSVLGRAASTIASSQPVRNALSLFGATPGRDTLAGAGASALGEAGRAVGGVPGQVAGTIVGGLAGNSAGNALSRIGGTRTPNALMQSADELDVTMLPADVGGVATRMASGATGRTLGGIPMAEAAERSVASAGRARDRLASNIGDVSDDAGAGQAVRRGFTDFKSGSAKRANELYDNISVPPKAEVELTNTRTALADVTRGLQSNPELSKLWTNHPRLRESLEALTPKDPAPLGREQFIAASKELTDAQDNYQRVRSAVTSANELNAARQAVDAARAKVDEAQKLASSMPEGGKLSWEDMKRFRTIVGEIVDQPGISRDGSDIAALRKLYGALSTDMEQTAARAGPKALDEFRKANRYYRGREDRIDNVFQGLFGNRDQRSDEAVFRSINSWAQGRTGDFARLSKTIRSLPADEANTVRATIVQRMGMASPARGGAEVFSPAEFSTQWRGLSDRAKSVLFNNKQHRQDLDKFARLTDGMKRAGEYQNFSNTSLGVNMTAQGALALTNLPVAIALGAGQFGMGKLLASPRFARIVASSGESVTPQNVRKLDQQLSVLATREPLLSGDIKSLQEHLRQAIQQSPGRAAADEEADRRGEPPQQ